MVLAATLGALVFASAPALAAGPESPEALKPEPIKPTEATLQGVVNPKITAASEPGTYQFLYKATKIDTKAECESAGASKAPASAEMYFGLGPEPESEPVAGLTEGTEYAFCLAASTAGGTTVGSPFPFKTGLKLETPVNAKVKAGSITATTAEVEGELNPGKERKTDQGYFEILYKVSGLSEPPTGECEESATPFQSTSGVREEKVTEKLTGLEPNAKYTFCLRVGNEDGETTVGNAVHFTTLAAPATIGSEAVSNITSSEATLEGGVNPNNQFTECHFQYGSGSVAENTVPCSPEVLNDTYGEQEVSPKTVNSEGQTVPAPVGVAPGTTYHYRIVTKNAKGEESQGPENTFDTFEEPRDENASAITARTATLNGTIDPSHESEAGSYEFLYKESASECQLTAAEAEQAAKEAKEVHERLKTTALIVQKRAPEPAGIATGASPQHVSGEATGLHPGATYTYCLAVYNTDVSQAHPHGVLAAIGAPVQFTAGVAPPAIDASSASHETAVSAELEATIDPEGAATRYHFEYDTHPYAEGEAPHGSSTPAEEIPAGIDPVPVSAAVAGLSAGTTTYYWRVVAENTAGLSASVDHVLVYPTAGTELPDHRAYEMVTPPFKDGALVGDTFNAFGPDISNNGSRLIILASQCFGESKSCTVLRTLKVGEPYEFTRTPTGWVTTALAPPVTQFRLNSPWLVSADEGTSMFSMPTGPKGEDEWYKGEENGAHGSFLPIGPATPPGSTGPGQFETSTMVATADLSHVVWELEIVPRLGLMSWPFDKTISGFFGSRSLYEYAGTNRREPFLVGVEGGEGSTKLVNACGSGLGAYVYSDGTVHGDQNHWNALSADGHIVYFSTCGGLYARVDGETSEAHTLTIAPEGLFAGASEDGLEAFYVENEGLYESLCTKHCEGSGEEESHEERTTIDASAPEKVGEQPGVQRVIATSEDGSHVYFVANGELTAVPNKLGAKAKPGDCKKLRTSEGEGTCNLYVYERDERYPDGHLAFISAVPGSDFSLEEEYFKQANVTPDGRFLVFESHGALTPDDTRTAAEGELAPQIFEYDAESEQLVRISVGDDGFDDDGNAGTGAASIVLAGSAATHAGPARGDPTMSDNGEYVFFQSPIALTPHAVKTDTVIGHFSGLPEYAENVYEYHDGHVYLVSDGRDVGSSHTPCSTDSSLNPDIELFGSAVCLLGADTSGHDVFFTTSDQLVASDTDTQLDVYDARVCEAGSPCIAEPPPVLPPCDGENCHGIPAATPSLLTPGSASFDGEGNIPPVAPSVSPVKPKAKVAKCGKGFAKSKRGRCVRSARRSRRARKSNYGGSK